MTTQRISRPRAGRLLEAEISFLRSLERRMAGLLKLETDQRLALEATVAQLRICREVIADYSRRGPQE